MQFDYNDVSPAFSALTQPYNDGITQPVSEPTDLFAGFIPPVQFAPVTPTHFAQLSALHGPEFKPVYEAAPVHTHTHAAEVHSVVGRSVDVRG